VLRPPAGWSPPFAVCRARTLYFSGGSPRQPKLRPRGAACWRPYWLILAHTGSRPAVHQPSAAPCSLCCCRPLVVASAASAAPATTAAPSVPWWERPAPENVKHISTVQEMVDELVRAAFGGSVGELGFELPRPPAAMVTCRGDVARLGQARLPGLSHLRSTELHSCSTGFNASAPQDWSLCFRTSCCGRRRRTGSSL
jgi:hypothetical protein